MLILEAALTVILATRGAPVKGSHAIAQPAIVALSGGPALARAIKADLESISGTGTVKVNIESGTLFSARIAMSDFSAKICSQIHDRELVLSQIFPALNFNFYFDGPELARAIKADLESISGGGTVDVSIDSKTLFSIRIALPGFNPEIYSKIFDRELEFYRAFWDLNFDFYLGPKPTEPRSAE